MKCCLLILLSGHVKAMLTLSRRERWELRKEESPRLCVPPTRHNTPLSAFAVRQYCGTVPGSGTALYL